MLKKLRGYFAGIPTGSRPTPCRASHLHRDQVDYQNIFDNIDHRQEARISTDRKGRSGPLLAADHLYYEFTFLVKTSKSDFRSARSSKTLPSGSPLSTPPLSKPSNLTSSPSTLHHRWPSRSCCTTTTKMTRETPEVRSDKRKPREDRQNHRYHRYHSDIFRDWGFEPFPYLLISQLWY